MAQVKADVAKLPDAVASQVKDQSAKLKAELVELIKAEVKAALPKPEAPKPEEKKPEESKPEEKKPEEKKSE
jgi:actin-related protein 9